MVQSKLRRVSYSEYLAIEADSTVKHEFIDGLVLAMAGGTAEHAAIAANIIGILAAQLRNKPCRTYTSALRIRVQETGLATYPDVSVIYGQLELDPDDARGQTAVNPKVLFEVLSPSTEDYDRSDKRLDYQRIEALEDRLHAATRRSLPRPPRGLSTPGPRRATEPHRPIVRRSGSWDSRPLSKSMVRRPGCLQISKYVRLCE